MKCKASDFLNNNKITLSVDKMEISKNIKAVREFIGQTQQKPHIGKGLVDYFNLFVDTYIDLKKASKR